MTTLAPFLPAMLTAPAEQPLAGHYDILRVIGRGSFGLVYLASDRVGGHVAIKEFPVSAALAQGFLRELSAVFGLDHPNVVRCLNLFYNHRSRHFLIFEYVSGGNLRDLLERRGQLPLAEALPLMRQLCLGLEHAHGRQIVHRDLKPENVLLAFQADGSITPKIADLGLAQYLGAVRGSGGDGSPAYMAPEQFYEQVAPTNDLYSLGVLFYEILTGRRPFEGPPSRLMLAHLHDLPDLCLIEHLGCRLLIGDLLAKQPGRRPSSAGAVLVRLEDFSAEDPSGGQPAFTQRAVSPPMRETAVVAWQAALVAGKAWEAAGPSRTWDNPAANGLYVPTPLGGGRVLLAHPHCTDSLHLECDRLQPGFLIEEVRSVCWPDVSAPPGTPALLLTQRSIREDDGQTGRARIVFAHGVDEPRTFAADFDQRRFYLADDYRVYALDGAGRKLWQVVNSNYAVEPQLAYLADGSLVATTGPAAPALRIFGPTGQEETRFPLPAPAVALGLLPPAASGRPRFQAVLIGLGAEEPARLLTFEDRRVVDEQELGDGLFAARWHWGGVLSLRYRDNRVSWYAPGGRELFAHQAAGLVLDDGYLPAVGLLLLEADLARHRRVLRLLPVRWTAAAPSSSSQLTARCTPEPRPCIS